MVVRPELYPLTSPGQHYRSCRLKEMLRVCGGTAPCCVQGRGALVFLSDFGHDAAANITDMLLRLHPHGVSVVKVLEVFRSMASSRKYQSCWEGI